jgi:hypothetical protein
MQLKTKNMSDPTQLRQQIPHAAELILAILIHLNRDPVVRSALAASVKNEFFPHYVKKSLDLIEHPLNGNQQS